MKTSYSSVSIFLFLFLFIIIIFNVPADAQKARISRDDLLDQIRKNSSNYDPDTESLLFGNSSKSSDSNSSTVSSRKRLNFLSDYPEDLFDIASTWSVLLHAAFFLYFCLVLAVLIDSYFLVALRCISEVFHLPATIAGPTLLALGTSSPEFFTNVISVFFGESAVGTGAVVGSAVVNSVAIPGICGLSLVLLPKGLEIKSKNPYAILRDLVFYAFTVVTLTLAVKDNSVDWLESIIFIVLYALYIFVIYCWSFLRPHPRKFRRFIRRSVRLYSTDTITSEGSDTPDPTANLQVMEMMQQSHHLRMEDIKCVRILLSPFIYLMKYTIPPPARSWLAIVTFMIACVWITGLTYFNLWMVSLIAKYFKLPDSIVGMTILAIGTNIPELITNTILVLKYRLSDMALCHVFGSNIFDILICLGLPWFFKTLIITVRDGRDLGQLFAYIIPLEDVSYFYYDMTWLILSWIAIFVTFVFSGWKVSIKSGAFLVAFYLAFLICTLTLV